MITRRVFVRNGGLALVGLGATLPGFVVRTATATARRRYRNKILIVVFQRGGMDGLNAVIPFEEKRYYVDRPSIAVPPPRSGRESSLDLDGFFGLHPSLEPLLSLYKEGTLGVVQAVGSPDSTRSHFDAQDFMESAAPGNKRVGDGWLNRYLAENHDPTATSFRGVAMGGTLPRTLKGQAPAMALGDIDRFDLRAGRFQKQARSVYETLYHRESDSLLSGTAQEMFQAIEFLKKANPSQYQPKPGVEYPRGKFGQNLRQVCQLIQADIGVEVAFVEMGGWDHHINQGGVNGQLSNLLRELGQGLAAVRRDLDDRFEDVVMMTMSEFGRTVRENGSGGTDHGHANVMFVLGGPVKGGKVYGEWPGLDQAQLYEGRDLALTTDFRDVFAEVLVGHLGCESCQDVLPGFSVDPTRFTGVL